MIKYPPSLACLIFFVRIKLLALLDLWAAVGNLRAQDMVQPYNATSVPL